MLTELPRHEFFEVISRMMTYCDRPTGESLHRVAKLGRDFARIRLGLSLAEVEAIEAAGYLHDIGKLATPDAVLKHPGKLNSVQWEIMRQHVVIGYQMIASIPSLGQVPQVILAHHERWDGSGYPRGLKGDAIPFLARVCSIIDIWDALTNERPYKPAYSSARAIAILEEETADRKHDPELVQEFLRFIKSFPGS